jgi:hypothetical protein
MKTINMEVPLIDTPITINNKTDESNKTDIGLLTNK